MGRKLTEILVKVRDAATRPLRNIQKQLQRTGKSAKRAGSGFKEFNRIMFSATAFMGMFEKAFSRVFSAIEKGAEFDRIVIQFENAFGPKGKFFKALQAGTDTHVDLIESMRSAIALNSLGITKDLDQIAGLVTRAGVAAKKAGFSTAEGIQQMTAFMKDNSINHLQFLNLIAKSNKQLLVRLNTLKTQTGLMNTALTAEHKYRLGLELLLLATTGQMHGNRDLRDSVEDLKQSFGFLYKSIGRLMGKALAPLIDKISIIILKMSTWLDMMHKDTALLKLVRNITLTVGAFTALIAVIGTARLLWLALTVLMPGTLFLKLAAGVAIAVGVFTIFSSSLKTVWAVLKGVYQLVSSFLGDSDNFAKGVGQMDESLAKFLEENKLIKFVLTTAKVIAVVIQTLKGLFRVAFELLLFAVEPIWVMLKDLMGMIKFISDKLGVSKFFSKLFGGEGAGTPWSRVAAGGFGLNTLADKMKSGRKEGTVELGMEESRTGFHSLFSKMASGISKLFGEKTTNLDVEGNIPTSREDRVASLSKEARQIGGAEHSAMISRIQEAMKASSPGGEEVTNREYKDIWIAIHSVLKNIDDKTAEEGIGAANRRKMLGAGAY